MTYYSTDGTYTRLTLTRGVGWTLSFPDGTRIASNGGGSNSSIAQYFYDRNNNYLTFGSVTLPNGHVVNGIVDQFGRYVATDSNAATREDYIYSLGFNNESLMWTVKWKSIDVLRPYRTTPAIGGRQRGTSSNQTFRAVLKVVDRITLPAQLGNLSHQFNYNAPDHVSPFPTTPSNGWGEVSGITMPSGAQVGYQFFQDEYFQGMPNTRMVLNSSVSQKTLSYQSEYDGVANPVTETWSYDFTDGSSVIAAPDGGVTIHLFNDTTAPGPTAGLVFQEIYPNGDVIERTWQPNSPPASTGFSNPPGANFYVKNEFRSISDSNGNLVWTAIKDYDYDKNGNVTREADYDWVPYASAHPGGGGPSIPSGLSPKRVSVISYNNATANATDSSSNSGNAYWNASAPPLRGAVSATEVQDGTGGGV